MDIGKVLAELREELEMLNGAILSLERLQNVPPRRSRPEDSPRKPALHRPLPRGKSARRAVDSRGDAL